MDPMFFFYLTAGAMLFLVISLVLGHGDHVEPGHDFGGGAHHGHDLGHGHDAGGHSAGENMSIWSSQVLFLFIGGFGIAGYFAALSRLSFFITMMFGVLGGLALGYFGYSIINFFYRRQFASSIDSQEYIGFTGLVVTSINAGSVGQVRCEVGANRETFLAKSADGGTIPINSVVRITDMVGSTAIVETIDPNQLTETTWREEI